MKLVLLPGLDGTGMLFEPIVNVLPTSLQAQIISYPLNELLSYGELVQFVRSRLPLDEDYVLLAESFSGPIAIELAAMHPSHLRALVLCATFASNPNQPAKIVSPLFRKFAFAFDPPVFFIRRFLLGTNAPGHLIDKFRQAVRTVDPAVLAHRLKSVLQVDVRGMLTKCELPILYLAPTQDGLMKRSSLEEMQVIAQRMEVVDVAGPHLLLQSQPEKCGAIISRFVRSAASDQE